MRRLALLMAISLLSAAKPAVVKPIAATPLYGPWKFHTGDNSRWAAPDFNDANWETVSLSPPPGAHDGDVGLTGYVTGWTAKGHANYSGYAWYRLKLPLAGFKGRQLMLTGPPAVDDAYQVYTNGILLGGDGDFSNPVPIVYSIVPKIFALPSSILASIKKTGSITIAFRVWADPATVAASPGDAGGIHIASQIGCKPAIASVYHRQWMQTFYGYIVDAVEPLFFVLLALLALIVIPARANAAKKWLALALIFTAIVRFNQITFAWFQFESNHFYDLVREVIFTPLSIGAWVMAWSAWFGTAQKFKWLPKVVLLLTILYGICRLFSLPWFYPGHFHDSGPGFDTACNYLRLLLLLAMQMVVFTGMLKPNAHKWLVFATFLLIAAGLFAPELSQINVPGIWFPFGVGVSLTQFGYAVFIVLMFILLPATYKAAALKQKNLHENS